MQYIKKQDRKKFDDSIEEIVDKLTEHGFEPVNVGELNYVMSSIVWKLFKQNPSYTLGNNLIGTIQCVDREFYRRQLAILENRQLAILENKKILENGDI